MTRKEKGQQLLSDLKWFVDTLHPTQQLVVYLSRVTSDQTNDDYDLELTIEDDTFTVAHVIGSESVTLYGSDGVTEIKTFNNPLELPIVDVIKTVINNQLK